MPLFGGKKDEVTLKVEGMTCAHCQKTVGEALRSVPGVTAANVDLAFHRAKVEYDPDQADVPKLVDAVREAGYDATKLEV